MCDWTIYKHLSSLCVCVRARALVCSRKLLTRSLCHETSIFCFLVFPSMTYTERAGKEVNIVYIRLLAHLYSRGAGWVNRFNHLLDKTNSAFQTRLDKNRLRKVTVIHFLSVKKHIRGYYEACMLRTFSPAPLDS